MIERKYKGLPPLSVFYRRMLISCSIGILLMTATIAIGVLGFIWFEKMSFVDAFANAAMIVSSVGIIGNLNTVSGKIFCAFYSLFSNLAFISLIAIIFSPIIHRFFHKFHLDLQSKDSF